MKEEGRKPCALQKEHNITLCYPTTSTPTLQDVVRIYFKLK